MLRFLSISLSLLCLLCVPVLGSGLEGEGALEFDGVNDYVEIPGPLNVTDAFSIEAWIRPDSADYGVIYSNFDSSAGYGMGIGLNGSLYCRVNNDVYLLTDLTPHLGEWIHVAVTWAGSANGYIAAYVNGVMVSGSWCHLTEAASAANARIGARPSGGDFFQGAIDEVRVFDTYIYGSTIQTWKNRVIAPDHPDFAHLMGAWCCEDGSGQTLTGVVAGTDGRLGETTGSEASDPVWITSGMVGNEPASWGRVKALFAR